MNESPQLTLTQLKLKKWLETSKKSVKIGIC